MKSFFVLFLFGLFIVNKVLNKEQLILMKFYVCIWNNDLLKNRCFMDINHSVSAFGWDLFGCFYFFGFSIIPQLLSALTLDNKEQQIENEIEVSWFLDLNSSNCFFLLCHLQQQKHLLNFIFHEGANNHTPGSWKHPVNPQSTDSCSISMCRQMGCLCVTTTFLRFELGQHIHENYFISNCLVFLNDWVPHGQYTEKSHSTK